LKWRLLYIAQGHSQPQRLKDDSNGKGVFIITAFSTEVLSIDVLPNGMCHQIQHMNQGSYSFAFGQQPAKSNTDYAI
jgi:hypothetical protein